MIKRICIQILVAIPLALLAIILPDSPLNFDWILGWIGGAMALTLIEEK